MAVLCSLVDKKTNTSMLKMLELVCCRQDISIQISWKRTSNLIWVNNRGRARRVRVEPEPGDHRLERTEPESGEEDCKINVRIKRQDSRCCRQTDQSSPSAPLHLPEDIERPPVLHHYHKGLGFFNAYHTATCYNMLTCYYCWLLEFKAFTTQTTT